MAKQKYDNLLLSPKYRGCCGCCHIQTCTKILSLLFIFSYGFEIKVYVDKDEQNIWELFKIFYGFVSAIGIWIGIDKKRSSYLLPYFLGFIFRTLYFLVVIISIFIGSGYLYTNYGKQFYDIFSGRDAKALQRIFGDYSVTNFLIISFSLAFTVEYCFTSTIYKCYTYISIVSFQEDVKEAAKKSRKMKNGNNLKFSETKPLIKTSIIKKYSGFEFVEGIFFKYFKKSAPPNIVQPSKSVEPKTELSNQKETQLISYPQFETGLTQKSKSVKCALKIQLKNDNQQSEAAQIIVKLKSTAVIRKTIKLSSTKISNLTAAPLQSYFHPTYNSNSPKPDNHVNSEVQKDKKTLFDEAIKQNFQRQHNDVAYDFDAHSMNSPPFSSRNECHSGQKSIVTSGFASISDSDFSPIQSSSPKTEFASIVTFLFKSDETFAIEVYQNGKKWKLKNAFDNEWTPLYFSMAGPNLEIGEKAQIHCYQFREYVLYDIFKVIGKLKNEIKIDPEWKFKVVEKSGIQCFQIKTQNGLCLFPENIIVATFLKSMKLRAENYLNTEVNEVNFSSNFELTESQKSVFRIAASKIDLKLIF